MLSYPDEELRATATRLLTRPSDRSRGESSITIKGPDANATVIARDEIDLFKQSTRSLMPEGLEQSVSPQDIADLFTFITERTIAPDRGVDPAAERAAQLLDDSRPAADRQQRLENSLERPVALLEAMLRDLPANDPAEQYRRIPWIWRVSIATARENDREQLTAMLRLALPADNAPLHDWQAVVLGDGLINGLSQTGIWPHERIATLIGNDRELRRRWLHAIQSAVTMSDDASVKSGTRYDALRMVAMRGWSESGPQLVRYLKQSGNAELQMGAVSGLVDVPDPPATSALIAALPHLNDRNRQLAIDGLLRSEDRRRGLLQSLIAGETSADLIDPDSRADLQQSGTSDLRELASRAFARE